MRFDKDMWRQIRMFADAFQVTPEKYVEACVYTVMLAQLDARGPEIAQLALDVQHARRRAQLERAERAREDKTRPGAKAGLSQSLGDKLAAALEKKE